MKMPTYTHIIAMDKLIMSESFPTAAYKSSDRADAEKTCNRDTCSQADAAKFLRTFRSKSMARPTTPSSSRPSIV